MTIICAINDANAGKVWLGCDSGCLIEDTIVPEHRTKWLRFTGWALAFAEGGIAHDALEAERAKFPNQSKDISQVTSFIRTAFAKYDLGETRNGAKEFNVSGLIAHSSGELYNIDARLAVSRIPEATMWACGSGMKYALGADAALKVKGFSPQERIETSVFTAIDFDRGCLGEPIVESLG